MGIIAGAAFSSNSESSESLSEEVLAYTSVIQQYASQYGIPEYVSAIQAIMMQESGGRGTDPMQCSESPYNTRFPHTPGSITDPDYSIEVGVQTFADCIRQAGCSSPQDLHCKEAVIQKPMHCSFHRNRQLRMDGAVTEIPNTFPM